MKKRLFSILAAVMTAVSFSACKNAKKADARKLSIVTTIFPEYDWVMSILGENKDDAEVTMLLDNGVDLHSYQPTAEDILKITTCDMFIYVGSLLISALVIFPALSSMRLFKSFRSVTICAAVLSLICT
ncbi:MAG: zinc ABC transporter substrate-binding protein, partial [Clostridiales bacterium]|nr:zinc ABC transporter substrate-binding protein [Clostridiales bacterium]